MYFYQSFSFHELSVSLSLSLSMSSGKPLSLSFHGAVCKPLSLSFHELSASLSLSFHELSKPLSLSFHELLSLSLSMVLSVSLSLSFHELSVSLSLSFHELSPLPLSLSFNELSVSLSLSLSMSSVCKPLSLSFHELSVSLSLSLSMSSLLSHLSQNISLHPYLSLSPHELCRHLSKPLRKEALSLSNSFLFSIVSLNNFFSMYFKLLFLVNLSRFLCTACFHDNCIDLNDISVSFSLIDVFVEVGPQKQCFLFERCDSISLEEAITIFAFSLSLSLSGKYFCYFFLTTSVSLSLFPVHCSLLCLPVLSAPCFGCGGDDRLCEIIMLNLATDEVEDTEPGDLSAAIRIQGLPSMRAPSQCTCCHVKVHCSLYSLSHSHSPTLSSIFTHSLSLSLLSFFSHIMFKKCKI
ncbi:unnamed protein product [Acanthosepion pharaonis]|uniref:Uncharacterized protein n=1 Tax=Acanthosepion pharaonis TaxID=158019 RepID=A0A812BPM5_ACAPH|nr:unnamed protein product [Sepia pharaonis]